MTPSKLVPGLNAAYVPLMASAVSHHGSYLLRKKSIDGTTPVPLTIQVLLQEGHVCQCAGRSTLLFS